MSYFMVSSIDLIQFLNKHFLDKKCLVGSGRVWSETHHRLIEIFWSDVVGSGRVWLLEVLERSQIF
jgi:hypothetical protein